MKTLLRRVFGIFPVVRNALRDGENFLPVTKDQFSKACASPRFVAATKASSECLFVLIVGAVLMNPILRRCCGIK